MTETSTPAIDRAAIMAQLKDLARQSEDDPEQTHQQAAAILCDLLRKLGFEDVVDVYNEGEKWYS